MFKRTTSYVAIAAIATAVVFAGCRKDESTTASSAASAVAKITDDQLLSKLAEADAADGTTDKVVSKCLMCKLGMDGDAAHSVEFMGYTLHFCKDDCLERFKQDSAKAIADLTIPGH